jgi:hypothetical protein
MEGDCRDFAVRCGVKVARDGCAGLPATSRLHFVADVPASLEIARLRRRGVGLRGDLPYALANARIHAKVAHASAATSAAALPLPLKVIVALGSLLPHSLSVRKLSAISDRVVMHVVLSMRMLASKREARQVTVHAMHAVSANSTRTRHDAAVSGNSTCTRHDAAVTASASATSASQSLAPRVDCAEQRRGYRSKNKNGFGVHKV